MDTQIAINQYAKGHMVSTRITATSIRDNAEKSILGGQGVVFDFSGVDATQSFIDELIGILILKCGPDILDKITFKSCSSDVKATIQFVIDDRADQYIKTHMH